MSPALRSPCQQHWCFRQNTIMCLWTTYCFVRHDCVIWKSMCVFNVFFCFVFWSRTLKIRIFIAHCMQAHFISNRSSWLCYHLRWKHAPMMALWSSFRHSIFCGYVQHSLVSLRMLRNFKKINALSAMLGELSCMFVQLIKYRHLPHTIVLVKNGSKNCEVGGVGVGCVGCGVGGERNSILAKPKRRNVFI